MVSEFGKPKSCGVCRFAPGTPPPHTWWFCDGQLSPAARTPSTELPTGLGAFVPAPGRPPSPTVFAVKVWGAHPPRAALREREGAAVAVVTASPTRPGSLMREGEGRPASRGAGPAGRTRVHCRASGLSGAR